MPNSGFSLLINPSDMIVKILVGGWSWSHAYSRTFFDNHVVGENFYLILFKQKEVVAKIQQLPVKAFVAE